MNYKEVLAELKKTEQLLDEVKKKKLEIVFDLAEKEKQYQTKRLDLRQALMEAMIADDTVIDNDGKRRIDIQGIGEASITKDRMKIIIEDESVVLDELNKLGYNFAVTKLDVSRAKTWYESTGENTAGMKRVEEPSLRISFNKE